LPSAEFIGTGMPAMKELMHRIQLRDMVSRKHAAV